MKHWMKKAAATVLAAVLALPSGIAGAAAQFPDVNSKTVTPDVQQAIESLAEQGIIKGFPNGTFGLNQSMTRAQFAKILAQIKGLEPNPVAAAQFTDVKDPEQKGWIGALVAAGLTTGTGSATYSPNRPIQRDQAATFLVRALGLEDLAKELNMTPTTADGGQINESHKANVGLLEKIGLIKGYPNGFFGPGDAFKRQQAASLLYKIQQEGDTYVSAARSLLNHVEVMQNKDGTLTIKGVVSGAAKVDIVLREAGIGSSAGTPQLAVIQESNDGKIILEQKDVKTNENGAFEWTTTQRFVLSAKYVLIVIGRDDAGNELWTLNKDVTIEEGAVQGLTEAADLIHAYSEGKIVYFVFDEKIWRIEKEDAFFIVTYGGDIVSAKSAQLQDDEITVKAEFRNATEVRRATLAGVRQRAVSDQDWNENIEALLPLNNAKFGGTTEGPDLTSVKVASFKLEKDGANETIEVEYVFDKVIDNTIDDAYASNFLLFLKDGTKLAGTNIEKQKKETVIVHFDVKWSGTTINSGVTSDVIRGYGGVIQRDDIALAAVLPGVAMDDKKNPNPANAVDVRAKLTTNGLQNAEVNFSKGIITFSFRNRVEGILKQKDVEDYFAIVGVNGETTTIGTLKPSKIDIDGKTVAIELSKKSKDHSQALINLAGVAIIDFMDGSEENERIAPVYKSIQRSYNAGETYAPTLKGIEAEYKASDESLIIAFKFSTKIKETSVAADRFKLYNVNGEQIDADVYMDEVEDNTVIVEFEMNEEDLRQVVVVAVEEGAVVASDDFKVGSEGDKFLLNPACHVALE